MLLTVKSVKKLSAAAVCLLAAGAVSGCASWRFQDSAAPKAAAAPAAKAAAAPIDSVAQSDLPPPEESGALPAAAAAGGPDLTPAGIAGVWKANLGGMTCQLATPQTKAGKGYRAGAIHCPAAFAQLGSWNINGNQLIFYDKSGNSLAVLYAAGESRFAGRTKPGMPVSLSR